MGWRAALRMPASPASPACAVTACSRSAPPELAASRVHRADLSQLSPHQAPATSIPRRAGAGGLAGGQGAPSHSLVSARRGWRGQEGSACPCRGSRGSQLPHGVDGEAYHDVPAETCGGCCTAPGLCFGVAGLGVLALPLGVSVLGGDCYSAGSSSSAAHLFPVKATQSVNIAEPATFSARVLKRKETDVMWKRNGKWP